MWSEQRAREVSGDAYLKKSKLVRFVRRTASAARIKHAAADT
jgi:hypothetical protein